MGCRKSKRRAERTNEKLPLGLPHGLQAGLLCSRAQPRCAPSARRAHDSGALSGPMSDEAGAENPSTSAFDKEQVDTCSALVSSVGIAKAKHGPETVEGPGASDTDVAASDGSDVAAQASPNICNETNRRSSSIGGMLRKRSLRISKEKPSIPDRSQDGDLLQEQHFPARVDLHINMERMGCTGTRQTWEDAALAFLARGKARTLQGTPLQTWVSVQHELKLAAEHGTPVSTTSRQAYMQMGSAQRAIDAAGNSAKAAEAEWARREAMSGKRRYDRLSFREDNAPREKLRDQGGGAIAESSTITQPAADFKEQDYDNPAHTHPTQYESSKPSTALNVLCCCSLRRRHRTRHLQARVLPNPGPIHQTAWGEESLEQCKQLSAQLSQHSPAPGGTTGTASSSSSVSSSLSAAAAAGHVIPKPSEVTMVRRFSTS